MTTLVANGERRRMWWVQVDERPRRGKVVLEGECPFCHATTRAAAWSLAGTGKRCRCGALLGRVNAAAYDGPAPVKRVRDGLFRTLDHAYWFEWRSYGTGTHGVPGPRAWIICGGPGQPPLAFMGVTTAFHTLREARESLAGWWRLP